MQGMTIDRNVPKGVPLGVVANNGVFDQFRSQKGPFHINDKQQANMYNDFPSSSTSCKNDLYSE